MVSVSKVACSELPEWAAATACPVDFGRGRRFFVTDLQRTAVDFGKLRVSAAHFDQDYDGPVAANSVPSAQTAGQPLIDQASPACHAIGPAPANLPNM
jgi:hypothetical protein